MCEFGLPRKKKVYRKIQKILVAKYGPGVAQACLSRMSLHPTSYDEWEFWFALDEEDPGRGDTDGDSGTSYATFSRDVRDPKEPRRPGIAVQFYGVGAAVERAAFAEAGPKCAVCGGVAACFGVYEPETPENPRAFACDECCGHGNEDGWCVPVEDMAAHGLAIPGVSGV